MKARIYVCHTYYHVYVSFLKELSRASTGQEKATLVLSTMTLPFGLDFAERIRESAVFEEVIFFDEKRDDFFPELAPYRNMRGNQIKIMLGRMKYTKLYAKLEEPYIPVDFKLYKDIYVFCDSDPIGYYLNYKKIYYHAVEDGLNTLKYCDSARVRNQKFFKLKVLLAKWNLIFIQNGYSKYCIDMEINDISCLKYSCPNYIEVPRKKLVEALSGRQIQILLNVFIKNYKELESLIAKEEDMLLILTEPLCDLETREKIFREIAVTYREEGRLVFKPHPNDWMDYEKVFPGDIVIAKEVPMEMLNFIPDISFKKVIAVFTELSDISFAETKVRLGEEFMDRFEDPAIHRYNDKL